MRRYPEAIPLLGKLLQFGARGYRVGRDLEGSIQRLCDKLVVKAKQAQANQANQPDPESE